MEKKHRWFAHPRSFLNLAVAGFAFVALPLVVALITGAYFVEKLSTQSQEAVYRAVKATQAGRVLLEQTATMERVIRQYYVLKDDSLFKNYLDRHEVYAESAAKLSHFLVDPNLKEQLEMLNKLELSLFQRLQLAPASLAKPDVQEMELMALSELAQALLRDSDELIDSEMKIMQDISRRARTIIYWEVFMVLPGTILFISVFVYLLSKPIRQIDGAIKQLGAGEFEQEFVVSGPRDVEYIGERLNWLRGRLKYLEEKKSKFLQYVSHELKTPLTAVREGAELLSEGVIGPMTEEQKEVALILKNNSINLQKMIEKLLSFNMPQQSNRPVNISSVQLQRIIETVLADHKPALLAKKIQLVRNIEDVELYVDEEQIRVVIDNLLSNAVKYTPESGSIRVSLYRVKDQVVFDVIDSGPGLGEHDIEKIFDAFYQGSSNDPGVIRGSGLGLSIVKEFVEANHGSVKVMQDQRQGAHFRVNLPQNITDNEELQWAAV